MVRYLEFEHIFKHPFEKVIRAYFQKYTSGKDSNVTSIRVVEHKVGLKVPVINIKRTFEPNPETGEEYMIRRGECVNVLPGILKKVCPYPALEVEEEVWLNKKEKCLHLHCYNLTWSKYAFLEEYSCYRACDSNPDWTLFEQRASINVYGVGSVIGGMFEAFGQRFFQHGAKKGFNIMEDLIVGS